MATAAKAKVTRNRAPSPFHPRLKVTLSLHNEAGNSIPTDEIAGVLTDYFGQFAVRTVSRSRATKSGKPSSGPANLMVYIAPAGYEFAKTGERGVRLDADTAALLRQVASSMGLDPNDSASIVAVAKALAQKATASQS